MRTTPLVPGDELPTLELSHEDGRPADPETLQATDPRAVYFMRTPSCPVCHAHLRQMARAPHGTGTLADHVIVIVPGSPADAAVVARRHPAFAGRVLSSQTAHAAVGLFVRAGLQQSGTIVVDSNGTVVASRSSTVPTSSFKEDEVRTALESARV